MTLTNVGSVSCAEQGFPGVSLLSSAGQEVGAPAVRVTAGAANDVRLARGQAASATVVSSPDTCDDGNPPSSAEIRVFPPGQTGALTLAAVIPVCTLDVYPLVAGTTSPFR